MGGKKVRISYICHDRIDANLTVASRGKSNESLGAKFTRNQYFFPSFQSRSLDPKDFCMGATGTPHQSVGFSGANQQHDVHNLQMTNELVCPWLFAPTPIHTHIQKSYYYIKFTSNMLFTIYSWQMSWCVCPCIGRFSDCRYSQKKKKKIHYICDVENHILHAQCCDESSTLITMLFVIGWYLFWHEAIV